VAPTGYAPAYEREFALTEPMFDCRIYQRGAQWHWQVMNDFEHVLASGIAERSRFAMPPTPGQPFRTQLDGLMELFRR
jgi:hypothetical protein